MAPKVGLKALIGYLNQNSVKPRWGMTETTKGRSKIVVPGFTGVIKKRAFSTRLWQAIAALLESGDISNIGQCRICETYFAKRRAGKNVALTRHVEKKYESQLSADRQARERRKQKLHQCNAKRFK
jgi:hypothetical protein